MTPIRPPAPSSPSEVLHPEPHRPFFVAEEVQSSRQDPSPRGPQDEVPTVRPAKP